MCPSTTIADQSSKKAKHSIEHMHIIESAESISAPLHIFTADSEKPLEETENYIRNKHNIESGENISIPSLPISTTNAEKLQRETELSIGPMNVIESGESIRTPVSHISTENAEQPLEGKPFFEYILFYVFKVLIYVNKENNYKF